MEWVVYTNSSLLVYFSCTSPLSHLTLSPVHCLRWQQENASVCVDEVARSASRVLLTPQRGAMKM